MLGGLGHSTEQQLCKQVEVVSITESCVDVEAAAGAWIGTARRHMNASAPSRALEGPRSG